MSCSLASSTGRVGNKRDFYQRQACTPALTSADYCSLEQPDQEPWVTRTGQPWQSACSVPDASHERAFWSRQGPRRTHRQGPGRGLCLSRPCCAASPFLHVPFGFPGPEPLAPLAPAGLLETSWTGTGWLTWPGECSPCFRGSVHSSVVQHAGTLWPSRSW